MSLGQKGIGIVSIISIIQTVSKGKCPGRRIGDAVNMHAIQSQALSPQCDSCIALFYGHCHLSYMILIYIINKTGFPATILGELSKTLNKILQVKVACIIQSLLEYYCSCDFNKHQSIVMLTLPNMMCWTNYFICQS